MNVPFVDMHRLHAETRDQVLAAFARVLDSGGFVQGPEVDAFEREFAAQYATPPAVALNSGTAALHLALEASGIGAGDEVITVANTFIATAEAITLARATPVFADIEPGGFNIDPDDAERRITSRTKAIIVVHLYGQIAQIGQATPGGGVDPRHVHRPSLLNQEVEGCGAGPRAQPAGGDQGLDGHGRRVRVRPFEGRGVGRHTGDAHVSAIGLPAAVRGRHGGVALLGGQPVHRGGGHRTPDAVQPEQGERADRPAQRRSTPERRGRARASPAAAAPARIAHPRGTSDPPRSGQSRLSPDRRRARPRSRASADARLERRRRGGRL